MSKSFDLLIFDWDGTLMDSEAHIVHCLEHALRAVEAPVGSAQELKQVIGLGLDEAMRALLPEASHAEIQQSAEAFRQQFLSGHATPSVLFPQVQASLADFSRSGYLLAVATGKSRRGLDKVLQQTGLNDLFAVTRCADETFSKPHPRMLEEILVDLDTSPERALMIGDTEYDLQMAASIGMPAVGVSYGVHDSERLQNHAPLDILPSFQAFAEWLADNERG